MFFRRGFMNPTVAFSQYGAKSFNYMGIEMTRRHCATARNSLLRGFVDPMSFLSSTASASGATAVICALANQVAATRAISMSAIEDIDLSLMTAIVEQHLATPFSLLSFYVPSGCSCGTVPFSRLTMLEEFSSLSQKE
jgi:hypothetical protein